MESLQQIWQRLKEQGHETDKGSVHSYLPVYEKLFDQYRETALNVLEIGCFNGASIRMWAEYFTKAHIWGVDCSLTPHGGMADLVPLIDEIVSSEPHDKLFYCDIHIFDAENSIEVAKKFSSIKFDIIIEDANHSIEQQLNLFKIWQPYLVKDGIYIIEDIQDIGKDEQRLRELLPGKGMTIIDDRQKKGRYDDVMCIIRNKYL